MKRKVVKIGNALGITLPQEIREDAGLKLGDSVMIEHNTADQSILISKSGKKKATSKLTPEFYDWLERFNKKYKKALTELAKK